MSNSKNGRRKRRGNEVVNLDLVRLLEASPEIRRRWNEEAQKHSNFAIADWHRRARKGEEKYARKIKNIDDFKLTKQSGEVTLKWEVEAADWLIFRIEVGNYKHEIATDKSRIGVADRVQADHFKANIDALLFRTALRLVEGSLIFASTSVLGVNPLSWRKRLMKRVEEDWKQVTGDTKQGRKFGSVANPIERSRESNKLAEEVKTAIQRLFRGPLDPKFKKRGTNPFYDESEITRPLVARYLHQRSDAAFGNRLSRLGLKFRKLKKEALAKCN